MATAAETLLTTAEACAFLRLGKTSFYRQAGLKKLRRVRFGRSVRWRRSDLEQFVSAMIRTR